MEFEPGIFELKSLSLSFTLCSLCKFFFFNKKIEKKYNGNLVQLCMERCNKRNEGWVKCFTLYYVGVKVLTWKVV